MFRSSFNFDELLKCADKYLYQSKKQGRDLHTGGVCKPYVAAKIWSE